MPRKSEGPRLRMRPRRPNWFIRYKDPKSGIWRDESTGTSDRREAELIFAEFLLTYDEPIEKRLRREGMLISEALARYALRPVKPDKQGSKERLRYSIKNLVPVIGHRRVHEIDEDLLVEYQLASKDRSQSTIRRELSDLRSAVNYVARKRFVERIIFPELPEDGEPKMRWLTEEEFARLLWHARSIKLSRFNLLTFLMIAFYTGARKSAIMDLEWSQIDFIENEIRFQKEGATRSNKRKAVTPLAKELRRHLERRRNKLGSDSRYVFVQKTSHQTKVASVDTGFETAVRLAGFDDVTPHTLRHTRASLMIQGGTHMKVISEILDMSLETLDKIYAHLSKKELNEMSEWMGRKKAMRSQNVHTSYMPKQQNRSKLLK